MARTGITQNIFGFLGIGPQPSQKVTPTKEIGVAGFSAYGGIIDSNERNPLLVGTERYRTTSDILANTSIVAAGTRYFLNLIAKSNWSVEPAEDRPENEDDPHSDEAKEAADFVESAMYDMETSWVRMVRRSAMVRFHGFSFQEWTAKMRDDGRIGFASINARPQHTISRWALDEHGRVMGVFQTNPQTFAELYLPRPKLIYLVDDTLTDSPEGFGLFRHLIEPAKRLEAYLLQEGIGFERDMRGIPVGRAPLNAIEQDVTSSKMTREQATALLTGFKNFVANQVKAKNTGLVMDSETYSAIGDAGNSVSAIYKWGLELLNGGSTGFTDMGNAINRLNREMARIIGVEHLMLGESGGSRSLADDKSRNLFLQIESTLGDMAEGYERDFIGPLWTMNGLDDALKPTLKFEAVQFRDVQLVTASLRDMATAGAVMSPNDPAINDVRDLLGISQQPDDIALDVTLPRPGDINADELPDEDEELDT